MNAEVVAEPHDGGAAESGGAGGVGGAEGVKSEGILQRVCGDGGFEERFWRAEGGGEREVGEGGDLRWDSGFGGSGGGGDLLRREKVGGEESGERGKRERN